MLKLRCSLEIYEFWCTFEESGLRSLQMACTKGLQISEFFLVKCISKESVPPLWSANAWTCLRRQENSEQEYCVQGKCAGKWFFLCVCLEMTLHRSLATFIPFFEKERKFPLNFQINCISKDTTFYVQSFFRTTIGSCSSSQNV